jgi:hypothetical protein
LVTRAEVVACFTAMVRPFSSQSRMPSRTPQSKPETSIALPASEGRAGIEDPAVAAFESPGVAAFHSDTSSVHLDRVFSSPEKPGLRRMLSTKKCLLAILAVWLVCLAVLFTLQLCKTGLGLEVWPMGEDRVWINLLQNNHGAGVARGFWVINDRNPLSPWWYVAAGPIILGQDYGIYFVRKLVDLVLAVITFFLIDQLGKKQHRAFALTCAILVSLWNFSFYYNEQIMWNFLMALGLTASSSLFYVKFLDAGRKQGRYLAVSLLLYFAAFSTYSIQCGALIANFCLALLRKNDGETFFCKLRAAVGDASIFASLFALYLLSWATTSHPVSESYALHTRLFKKQFFPSLQSLIWPADYASFQSQIAANWPPFLIALSAIGFFALFYFGFKKIWTREGGVTSRVVDSTGLVDSSALSENKNFYLTVLAVIVGVSVPTILLESMSQVWFPGTRVRMIAQFVSPCLYCVTILAASNWLRKVNVSLARQFLIASFAILGVAAVLMGLQYNKSLCAQTAFERHLVDGLRPYLLSDKLDQYFVLRLDDCHWFMSPTLDDTFIQTAFNQSVVHLRILSKDPAPPGFENIWNVELSNQGVKHAGFTTGDVKVPWQRVAIVSFDGRKVHLIDPIKPEDLSGYQASFVGAAPFHQPQTVGSKVQ